MTKEYSCVKRTKKAFEDALSTLAKKQPMNKITVKNLCETAQLSRNAFYFHYKDINDLIEEVENSVIDDAAKLLDELDKVGFPKSVHLTVDALIDLFDERKDTVMMLLDASFSTSFTNRVSKMFSEYNYKYFKVFHDEGKKTSYDFFYMFMSSGFYGIIKYWLENPEEMSKSSLKGLTYILIKRLLVPGDPDIDGFKPAKK